MNKKKLTPKQRAFCDEYLVDTNASAAALRAGYSPKTAGVIGQENLTKPIIKAVIKAALNKRSEKVGVTSESVVNDLHYLAEMMLGRKPTKKAAMVDGQMVETEVLEVNGPAANAALVSLGRHCGIFEKDKNQDVNALFIAGIRNFITQEATLPRDRKQDRLENDDE